MEGMLLRGRLAKIEWPETEDGFANVTVECRKRTGEPYWQRAALSVLNRNTGEQTAVAAHLAEMREGATVELGVQAKIGRTKTNPQTGEVIPGSLWYLVVGINEQLSLDSAAA